MATRIRHRRGTDYVLHQIYDLMKDIASDRMSTRNFVDGQRCQEILETIGRSAAKKERVG